MKNKNFDNSFIMEALPAFISEAQEQVVMLEQLLLKIEETPHDKELLGALFRCAHTVKGSAGIFGLDAIVAFTHHVETLLDHLREGDIIFTPPLGTLLLECNDQIRALIDVAQEPNAEATDASEIRAALVERLKSASAISTDKPVTSPTPDDASAEEPTPELLLSWKISADFSLDTFRNGMDPLAILSYLRGLGEVSHLTCKTIDLPTLDILDPENCHLGFDLTLETTAPLSEIEDAFSFVRDDCLISIQSVSAPTVDFSTRIDAISTDPKLGDILITVGAISPAELRGALELQSNDPREKSLPIGEILSATSGVSPKLIDAALQKQKIFRETPASIPEPSTLRVSVEKVDQLINLVGELVITQAMLAQTSAEVEPAVYQRMAAGLADLDRNTRDLQQAVMSIRMIPMSMVFSRFPRMLRDLAARLGKKMEFITRGEATELDKGLVEKIIDPLTHLVRNSCDHGIELPAERLVAGKPETGTLILSASHQGGSIVIEVSDDGRGLSRKKLLSKAQERGVDASESMTDTDVWNLIFSPGFSTAAEVTDVSGRGVGMDVVKKNIAALGGTVEIDSREGAGMTVRVRLPLTLAIMDSMSVGVGAECYILPLSSVVESFLLTEDKLKTLGGGGRVVQVRDEFLQVIELEKIFHVPRDTENLSRSIMVVVESDGTRMGLMVDELLGQQQVVVKNLESNYRKVQHISGATIMGDGRVALILDVGSLARGPLH